MDLERSNRDAADHEDFVINVCGSDGNTELTVPYTKKPSTRKRPDLDEEKVHEKHVAKRSKVAVEKMIADSSERTGQQVGLVFRDFTEEFKQLFRDEMAKHWKEVKLSLEGAELSRSGNRVPLQPARAARKHRAVHGPSGTLADLEDFFAELRHAGTLEKKEGARVYIHRSLVPIWRTFMTAKSSFYVDVKDNTLGKELRDLCNEADDLPDDHPARSMQMKKQYCLVGWYLSTDEEE